jgi:hypothetical protein
MSETQKPARCQMSELLALIEQYEDEKNDLEQRIMRIAGYSGGLRRALELWNAWGVRE